MDEKPTGQKPDKTSETRKDRLKQALKANLARRKAQAKARNAGVDNCDEGKG